MTFRGGACARFAASAHSRAPGVLLRGHAVVLLETFGEIGVAVETRFVEYFRDAQLALAEVLRRAFELDRADEIVYRLAGQGLYLAVYVLVGAVDALAQRLDVEIRIFEILLDDLYQFEDEFVVLGFDHDLRGS